MFDFVSRACDYLGDMWSRPHLLGTQKIPQVQSVRDLQPLSLETGNAYLNRRSVAIKNRRETCEVYIDLLEKTSAVIMTAAAIYGACAISPFWKSRLGEFPSFSVIGSLCVSGLTYLICALAREKIHKEVFRELEKDHDVIAAVNQLAVSNPKSSVAPSV